jgi:hypothetical protein
MSDPGLRFPLAPMSAPILALTCMLLVLPVALATSAAFGEAALLVPALLVSAAYVWVRLRMRPREFVVHRDRLEVIWPLGRRSIGRSGIRSIRRIDKEGLREEVGTVVRVGAGGLWGGFGWLWTKKRGTAQMYVSRDDGLVWIELGHGRPWLITPDRPDEFVAALSCRRENGHEPGAEVLPVPSAGSDLSQDQGRIKPVVHGLR